MINRLSLYTVVLFTFTFCSHSQKGQPDTSSKQDTTLIERTTVSEPVEISHYPHDSTHKTIHIIVALCDNQYQGIAPVPVSIGNGQNPSSNLYWGAGYGIKTFFKRSKEWTLIDDFEIDSIILERAIFKHKAMDVFLIADAYNGKFIYEATSDFLKSSAGLLKDTLRTNNHLLGINGSSSLIGYIGHDGLMDFQIQDEFRNVDGVRRDVMILACFSRYYFLPHLEYANVNPLVWTASLMAPEAYSIHDAISGYLKGESNEEVRLRAATSYAKYQRCSLGAANSIFVTE